jgi:hypothetical protein
MFRLLPRIFIFILTVAVTACSANLDWRQAVITTQNIQVKNLMPSKPQTHQTRLTHQNIELSSNELISRVQINKARGLFVLGVAQIPTTLPIERGSQQYLKQIFASFVQTQQQLISTQLKQNIITNEQTLFVSQSVNKTVNETIELIEEKWLIDQASQVNLTASAALLSASTLSHLSRFMLIKKEHKYWIIQQVYRGSLPLSKDDLSFWFLSLSLS